jgi:uncharacterized FlaG/YvyC family protein
MVEVNGVGPEGEIPSINGRSARATEAAAARASGGEAASAGAARAQLAQEIAARASVVNQALRNMDVRVQFQVERDAKNIKILVVDGETGDVIRKVPPDYFMKATAAATDDAGVKGIILDEAV